MVKQKGFFCSFWLLSLVLSLQPIVYAQNFVPVNEADVLVITHSSLRTVGWIPSQQGAWETELLTQKSAQNLSTAIWEVQDGINGQFGIVHYIEANQGSFRYVLIIGDARRPSDSWPTLQVDSVNFASGNIVPIFRMTRPNQAYWPPHYEPTVESDQFYIANVPNAVIGRIPAQNGQEIRDYVGKATQFLQQLDYSWFARVLEVVDDSSDSYNNSSGLLVQSWQFSTEEEFASTWPLSRLTATAGPVNIQLRPGQFESQVNNNTPGLIIATGTEAASWNLVGWYNSSCNFAFNNGQTVPGRLPVLLAMSCDIGGFDQYDENGTEISCVVERLVLMAGSGVLAAIAPTGPTLQTICGVYTKIAAKTLFTSGIRNIGSFTRESILATRGLVPSQDFVLDMVNLLGDPTLSMPSGAFSSGVWHASESPIRITQSIAVPADQTLTIEPGVQVLLSPDVSFYVYGTIMAQGTEENPIIFECSNPNARWSRLRIYSDDPENVLEHVIIRDADYGLFVANAQVNLDHVTVDSCLYGALFYQSSGEVKNSTFRNCDFYGIRLHMSPGMDLHDNLMEVNGWAYNPLSDVGYDGPFEQDSGIGIIDSMDQGVIYVIDASTWQQQLGISEVTNMVYCPAYPGGIYPGGSGCRLIKISISSINDVVGDWVNRGMRENQQIIAQGFLKRCLCHEFGHALGVDHHEACEDDRDGTPDMGDYHCVMTYIHDPGQNSQYNPLPTDSTSWSNWISTRLSGYSFLNDDWNCGSELRFCPEE